MAKKTILILALVMCVMTVPMVVNAENEDIKYDVNSGKSEFYIMANGSFYDGSGDYKIGTDYVISVPSGVNNLYVEYHCGVSYYLTSAQINALETAEKIDISISYVGALSDGSFIYIDPSSVAINPLISLTAYLGDINGDSDYDELLYQSYGNSLYIEGLTDFSGRDIDNIQIRVSDNLWLNSSMSYYMQTGVKSIAIRFKCYNIDGDYEVINVLTDINGSLTNIEQSLIDGFEGVGDKLDSVQDSVNQGIGNVTQKQDTIIDKITSGFANIGNQVKQAVTDAVTGLFVPSEESVQEFFGNMSEIEEEHLAPVAQIKGTINQIENTLLNPEYDVQLSGDLANVGSYLNRTQGDGMFIFPSFKMKLPDGKTKAETEYTLWEEQVIDVGATLDDLKLGWIPTVTKLICTALFTWGFIIKVLEWLAKITDNPTFNQWADMLRTFNFDYRPSW